MKTFNDLKFKKHPLGNGIQAKIEITPNIFISVIAGEGFYSTSKDGSKKPVTKVEDVISFEVGIIDENLPEDDQEWEVVGWQSRNDIDALLSNY